jgi:carbamoyl-phosphate synthase large subunit
MKRILVSGASGIVGYGILRSLQQSDKKLFLVGTSIYPDSVAPAFCDQFELAPVTTDSSYIPWLISMIKKHRIDMLIAGIEADMYSWVEHREAIQEAGALPLLNNSNLITLCKDKWLFYQTLAAANIDCVITSTLSNNFETLSTELGLPFLLKPRRGFGSKGIVRVHSLQQFELVKAEVGAILMAQPIVGTDDEEYTTSAFCDGTGGYFARMTLRRTLSKDGFTDKAEVVDSADFDPTLKQLCSLLKPVGPTNFQFRKSEGLVKLLEINPRVSSSTAIRTAFGYNESAMAVNFFLERTALNQPEIRRGKAVRYTDEHIFYDDSLYL